MKVDEIIQRVQSLYSKGVQSDDSRLSDRHIYNKMITVRSKLISQQHNKKQKISQWNFQSLNCVELIKAEPHECPCLPPAGCEILRTKYKIPRPLTGLNSHLIQSVTSVNGDVIFSEISWETKKYKSSNKYTAYKPDYYFRNGYLYITHKTGIKLISITGLFDDPLEAENFPSLCKENCKECNDCESFLDKEFPIDNDLLDTLIDMCKQELIVEFSQMREDLSNNSSDGILQESK